MSISSKLSMLKKSLTALVGAALIAGSLVPTSASADVVSTMFQPNKVVTLGGAFADYGSGADAVVRGGWLYTLQSSNDTPFAGANPANQAAIALKRTKVSTFGTAEPLVLFPQSYTSTTKTSTTGTVSESYLPVAMDISADGNTAFILDRISGNSRNYRLISIDLTGVADTATNLTGTVLGTLTNVYNYVTTVLAVDATHVAVFAGTQSYLGTISGSSVTFGSNISQSNSVNDAKLNSDGDIVTMNNDGTTIRISTLVPSTLVPRGAAVTVATTTDAGFYQYGGFAIAGNGDIVYVDKNGSRISRLVKNGSTYNAAKVEAVSGAAIYSATAIAATAGQTNTYDLTITGSTAGILVGDSISLGEPTYPQGQWGYVNGAQEPVVTAVSGQTVTFKTTSPMSIQGTITSMPVTFQTEMTALSGLAFDSSNNLLALDHGSVYSANNAWQALPVRVLNFKSHVPPLPVGSLTVRGGHKSVTFSFKVAGFIDDVASMSLYAFSGSTAEAAINAARAHTTLGTAVCSQTSNFYANQYVDCPKVTDVTPGNYYSQAVKVTALDGVETWTVPAAYAQNNMQNTAAQVLDAAVEATLPNDPDPAGPASPGFVHQGPTSANTAMSLLGSGLKYEVIADGRGGKFVMYQTGLDETTAVQIVHIKNTGEVDSAFGTSGVFSPAGQSTSASERNSSVNWYGTDGKAIYSDWNSTDRKWNFNLLSGSTASAWSLTQAEAITFCNTQATGQDNTQTAVDSISVISAATSDPMLMVKCRVGYRGTGYNGLSVAMPVFAKLTADHTLTAFAAPITGLTSYNSISASTDRLCLSSWIYGNDTVISDPAPAAGGTLFTMMVKSSALGGNPSNKWCDRWASDSIGESLSVKADGSVVRTANTLPAGQGAEPQVTGTGVTSDHTFYFWGTESYNGPVKIYRLKADGSLDGTVSNAIPACAGNYGGTLGLTEDGTGNVYLQNFTVPGNMGMSSSLVVYTSSVLIAKASGNTARIGSTHLSAPLTLNRRPANVGDYWSDFGTVFSTFVQDASGNMFYSYYAGSAGIKSVKFDSFSSALATGEDYLGCPPAPFEAVENVPSVQALGTSIVKMTDGNIFAYAQNGWGVTAGKAEIFTPGSDPKSGTYALTEASRDIHGEDAFVVALPGNKVLVGGGTGNGGTKTRSIEIYDPAAAAGSKWTKLTGTAGTTDVLPDVFLNGARSQLLANGKVLVFGGMDGDTYTANNKIYLVTIGGANESSTVEVGTTAGISYTNVIPAGTGKWLLFGTPYQSMPGSTATATTKIYTEAATGAGSLTDGPALSSQRAAPAVVDLGGGKTMIAGNNPQMMGGPVTGQNSYDVYDSATNAITTVNLVRTPNSPDFMNSMFTAGGGVVLPSGKVLLVPGRAAMNYSPEARNTARLLNLTTNVITTGDQTLSSMVDYKLFLIGEKVLIAGGMQWGGGGSGAPAWQVYTQPIVVEPISYVADNRRVLKGSTGNLTITSTQAFTLGSGATELSVTYTNGAGNVLKPLTNGPAAIRVSGATKLKLDATSTKLTLALPTAAQMVTGTAPGAGLGEVIATVRQGTTQLGTVSITYIPTKDTPMFTTSVPNNAVLPGMAGSITLGARTSFGNGTPVLTYKSTTAKVCTVDATGRVTRVSRGACTITVAQAADLGTNAATQTLNFTFAKSTAVLAFGQGTPAAGNIDLTEDDRQIVLAPTLDGAPAPLLDVDYSVDNDTNCSITDDGVLNTIAAGSCKVTVTFAGNADVNGPVSIDRTYTIVVPSQPVASEGTVGGVIGDAVFEGKDDPTDDLLTVSTNLPKAAAKNIKLGRGLTILYTPTVKNNVVTGATFSPAITSLLIGSVSTTFIIPASTFAKVPAGWTALPKPSKTVVATTYQCVLSYGSKTQVAASKKIKTVVSKGKTCALPAVTTPLLVKVKNNWTRLAQKKGSAVLTPQKRTVKINLQ